LFSLVWPQYNETGIWLLNWGLFHSYSNRRKLEAPIHVAVFSMLNVRMVRVEEERQIRQTAVIGLNVLLHFASNSCILSLFVVLKNN